MQVDYIFEKGTGNINEDFYFIDENLFGVLDGATSLTPKTYENGNTGGFLASNIAGQIFKKNNDSLKNLAVKANMEIKTAMVNNGVKLQEKANLWSTSAVVIRLGKDAFEWIQFGDCIVMAIYEDGSHEILSDNYDHDCETLMLWKKMADKTDKPVLSALKDQILKVRAQMNQTYGVLNGEQKALDFAQSGVKVLNKIKHILLFTDGLFIPKNDPAKADDFYLFSKLFLKGGLSLVRDVIRQMEKTDVGCRAYPRFKTHDDIAAISISL